MKIVSVYSSFESLGGAENMAVILAESLNNGAIPIILTKTPFKLIHKNYSSKNIIFEKFTLHNILKYNNENTIFVSHSRKETSLLMLINVFLLRKLFLIHVAHNTFANLSLFTWLPTNIIAVSNAVMQNLVEYFKVKRERINVIYNGIVDVGIRFDAKKNVRLQNKIKIICAGRICSIKQQVKFVENTKGNLNDNIEVFFAGVGDELSLLKDAIGSCDQYKMLGDINIKNELQNYDYVILVSQKEGMALSLIEGCMFGKPLITNDINAALEVNINGYNGFVARDWKELSNTINSLPNSSSDEYKRLSQNARKQYEELFLFEKMINSYKNTIKSIIDASF